jgi:hypothetical protein
LRGFHEKDIDSPSGPVRIAACHNADHRPKQNAWQWKGAWRDETQPRDYMDRNKAGVTGKVTTSAGAEAALTFEGVAVCLIGPMSQEGGRADVFLDGKKLDYIDAYVVERTFDYDLWRAYDLKPGKHTLRIVTRDDADARSKGKNVILRRAIIYR